MKKLLGIVVLGLLLSGSAYASNLIGKQLECNFADSKAVSATYFKFISDKKAQRYSINDYTLKMNKTSIYYNAYPKTIEIFWLGRDLKDFTLDRQTLKIIEHNPGGSCKIVTFNIENFLEKKSKQLLEKITKENKI
ncbi:hypothetical protein OA178_02215 [Candidatus Pelagibacter sp.]|nr:hypothetical protein [Candidatus Pelagibacter sp.]